MWSGFRTPLDVERERRREFEKRKRELVRKYRLETGRDPDDADYLEIVGAARVGRKTWKWP